MKKTILIMLVILLFSPLITALDSGLPMACGGDSELIIGCLGDEELIWIGIGPLVDIPTQTVGTGPEHTTIEKPIEVIKEEPFLFFSIIDVSFLRSLGLEPEDLWLIYGILIIFILFLFLYFRKRKCNKCKKKFKRKELTEYEKKHYCKECLEEIKKES